MIAFSLFMKLTLVLVITGFLMHFIGFVTPYWNSNADNTSSIGLWMICTHDQSSHYTACHSYVSHALPGLMIARGFESIAFIGFIGLFVSLGCYIKRDTYRFLMISLIGTWTIVFFIICGIISWGATRPDHLNWSFVFVVLSAVVTSVAGGILIRERIKSTATSVGGAGFTQQQFS